MGVSGSTGGIDVAAASGTPAEIRALRFGHAKGFGHGYDTGEVDRAVATCAALVDRLTGELLSARDEIAELRARLASEGDDARIEHSVNVLTTAQQTADKILAQADHQRAHANTERQEILAAAHAAAAALQRDSERRARQISDDATRRVASLEQELARLTGSVDLAQQEIDREAAHLQATRESGRALLDSAIDGVLDQLAEQFGRAHPLAAQAAGGRARSLTAGNPRQPGAGRARRGLRLAGRPTESASTSLPATSVPTQAGPENSRADR